jgi:hypothetical protein
MLYELILRLRDQPLPPKTKYEPPVMTKEEISRADETLREIRQEQGYDVGVGQNKLQLLRKWTEELLSKDKNRKF